MSEPDTTPVARHRHALAFLFVTVLIDMIGFGIVLPVLPELIMQLSDVGVSTASVYGGWLAFTYAVMQFFCGPIIGNLSDRFGRRPVLLLSLLAFGLDYLLMGMAPTLTWLFLGRAIAGIAGASYTSANAYVADISPPERRAQNFGLIGAAFGIGFIIGPALGGLFGGLGPRAPFFVAAILALANLVYGYVALPESHAPEMRRPFSWRRANTFGTLVAMRRYPVVMGLAVVLLLWQLSHQVLPSTWAFYMIEKFHWGEREIGLSLAYAGALMFLVQGILTRVLIPRIGEAAAVILGMSMAGLAYVGYAAASEGWMMYACITVGSFAGLTYPSLNGLMSQHIPTTAQGELQGGNASIYSLTAIVGPLMMTQLFGYFTSSAAPVYFPGAAFAFSAGLVLVGAMLFLRMIRAARSGVVATPESEAAPVAPDA